MVECLQLAIRNSEIQIYSFIEMFGYSNNFVQLKFKTCSLKKHMSRRELLHRLRVVIATGTYVSSLSVLF